MGHRCPRRAWRGKSRAGKQHSRALSYAHGTLDTAPEGEDTPRSETVDRTLPQRGEVFGSDRGLRDGVCGGEALPDR